MVKRNMARCQIPKTFITPNFSYTILQIKEPTWSLSDCRVILDLTELPKTNTPERVYVQRFNELKEKKTLRIRNTFIRTVRRAHKGLYLRLLPAIKTINKLYRAYLQFSLLKLMQSNLQLVWSWKVMQLNP